MTLKPNAPFYLRRYDTTEDDAGVTCYFYCADPGPGQPTEYTVFATDAEITGASTAQSMAALMRSKLQRKYRALGIAGAQLDNLLATFDSDGHPSGVPLTI